MNAIATTPAQSIGPMFSTVMSYDGCEAVIAENDPNAVVISGTLLDGNGGPVVGVVEFWSDGQFVRSLTMDGNFRVVLKKPTSKTNESDVLQAPYLNVDVSANDVFAAQFRTRIYFPDEEVLNRTDPILSLVEIERRSTLMATTEEGGLHFDIHLRGDAEQVFFAC